jgi:hypothetical protein
MSPEAGKKAIAKTKTNASDGNRNHGRPAHCLAL